MIEEQEPRHTGWTIGAIILIALFVAGSYVWSDIYHGPTITPSITTPATPNAGLLGGILPPIATLGTSTASSAAATTTATSTPSAH